MLKNYRFGFAPVGLALFAALMLPNILRFAVPAPNDLLRAESVTPAAVFTVCRIIFALVNFIL